jgi:hypothetical protein
MARLVSAAPVQTGSRSARPDTLARARRPENHAAVFASAGMGYPGPYAIKLNDFRYDGYRIFRGESRMLSGFNVKPD